MSSAESIYRDELRAMLEYDGVTVTIGGTDYSALRTNRQYDLNKQQRSYVEDYQISFVLDTDDTTPEIGDTITYDGNTYRVLSVDFDADGVQATCDCGSQYA